MDKRVYLLTIVSFVCGMVELIIGGILNMVADDLGVTVGAAGRLITVFSLTFAAAAPVLLFLTSRMERKKLTLISLFVFFLGNVVAVVSPFYSVLLISRVITALSGSLLVVLCLTMASHIVEPHYRARAIGVVMAGISGSIVLGVPIGLTLGNAFGWRAPFALIAMLTLLSMAGVYWLMEKMDSQPAVPLREQLSTLKNRKILSVHVISFLFLAGHITLYGYLAPFLKATMGLEGNWVSVIYFIYGIAAVSGGAVGGSLSDRFGPRPTILLVIVVFAAALFIIPYATFALPIFLFVMIFWGMASWAINPSVQSYLIELAPKTGDTQISLNNSSIHLGIAFGSLVGSIVIERSAVETNALVGALFIVVAGILAYPAIYRVRERAQ